VQAEALVSAFADVDLKRILSSPHVRCRQTVQPLALRRGLTLEIAPELEEGAKTEDAVALVERAAASGPAVLCSHGDVIPEVISRLVTLGMVIDGEPGWKKGSIWALERDATRFVRARYLGTPLGT
jgi:8-oxo-dGTP diphosphatase